MARQKVKRICPDGRREYDGDLPIAALDPRGSDVGLENPYNNGGGGGGSYPSFSDATNSGRCVWEGLALSCEKASRLSGSSAYI